MNASTSLSDSADNQTVVKQARNRDLTLENYYCPNIVNLNIQNIYVKTSYFSSFDVVLFFQLTK